MGQKRRNLWFSIAPLILVLLWPASVAAQCQKKRPVLQALRYDEDWSLLSDADCKKELLDQIKYIPLGRQNWYLSIGGEIRYKYENYENSGFGSDPETASGYILQRTFSTRTGTSGAACGSSLNFKAVLRKVATAARA